MAGATSENSVLCEARWKAVRAEVVAGHGAHLTQ